MAIKLNLELSRKTTATALVVKTGLESAIYYVQILRSEEMA